MIKVVEEHSISHFSAEPVITNHDSYSVSLTFLPTFSGTVKPFTKTQKGGLVPLAPTKASAFNPLHISFGPPLFYYCSKGVMKFLDSKEGMVYEWTKP